MVSLTTHELRLVVKSRGSKNYKNMSREKLLSTLDELECKLILYQKQVSSKSQNAISYTK